ncbi:MULTISPECIES: cytochrome c biogenesis CcdA family protein [Roseovarius]|jgi:cytochrome c-type biogenesis protein|uniref:Sulfur oxidation V protein n=2 Tax=Roseovarius nubinhibens TaxID=314263 RepID=A3SQY1_ROSNI|nr:cytochrome c biogenesis protein CcdA [Roseovarius nubinhibens]EAP75540.1 sulfur oxidation V protein [Roseovarius nubinhibens ISM]MBU2998568.1 cytochrome c biogenesis protein CcdA [Roseovarius nubinhibens]HAR53520.1 cytochrome C biogenesis protein CcdA [Roseovarius nubinhibens]|tara:strand:+ start:934 stop:1683 length:750 start_codon:yes stop_codon:yes gene_type:complete
MFDVSILGAMLGGLLVFFSPCVLPIVPFYLSYMAGASMAEISADGRLAPGLRRRAVLASVMFSLGIITVFVLLGAAAYGLSQTFRGLQTEFRIFAAIVVALMGLHFLGVIRIGFLNRMVQLEAGDTSNMSVLGAYVVGLAFAAGWTPCVGGVLTAVVFTASTEETALRGLILLITFGIGMTAPFVVAALFIGPFLRFAARFRRHLPKVEKAMGLLLLVFAALIATDTINLIANWMLTAFPAFQKIGSGF